MSAPDTYGEAMRWLTEARMLPDWLDNEAPLLQDILEQEAAILGQREEGAPL